MSVEEWATDVCGALKTFVTEITETQTDIQAAVSPETSPEQGREVLTTTFESMIESTDSLIGKIEDAGTPDVDGGEEVQEDLLTGLEDMKAALEEALPKIEALPDDPAAFQTEAAAVSTDLQTQLGGVGEALGAINAPELVEETRDVEACQSVGT